MSAKSKDMFNYSWFEHFFTHFVQTPQLNDSLALQRQEMRLF